MIGFVFLFFAVLAILYFQTSSTEKIVYEENFEDSFGAGTEPGSDLKYMPAMKKIQLDSEGNVYVAASRACWLYW